MGISGTECVRDRKVLYRPPSSGCLKGRFERYLDGRHTRAVVWFPEVRPDGGSTERSRTVNTRYLTLLPEDIDPRVRRRNRRQAVRAFPVLAPLLARRARCQEACAHWDLKWIPISTRRQIVTAVDQGEPLLPLLTRVLDAKPWMLQHISQHEELYREMFEGNIHHALAATRWATPELALTEAWELANFATARSVLDLLPDITNGENRRTFKRLLGRSLWVDQLGGFVGFVRELANWVALQRRFPAESPAGPQLGIESLPQWLRLARHWERIVNEQCRQISPSGLRVSDGRSLVSWPGLFEGSVCHLGYEFTCLIDRDALIKESLEMLNCAASFIVPALFGETYLLSVRAGVERVALVELQHDSDNGFQVEQAKGPRNTKLPEALSGVIVSFVKRLNSPEENNPCADSRRVVEEECQRQRARRALIGLDYSVATAWNRGIEHFTVLAQSWGAAGFEQYRPCLEAKLGTGRLLEEALQVAATLFAEERA